IRRLFPRVQRPKLLYSRTRQSDLKDYGKDRGIRSMITAGRPLKAAAYIILKDYGKDRGIRSMITAGRPLKAKIDDNCWKAAQSCCIRRLFPRVQRPKLLYSRTRQSDLKDYGKDRGL
ncbi:hypothetical protein Tco_0034705, partial [Tanacetum coccineum]